MENSINNPPLSVVFLTTLFINRCLQNTIQMISRAPLVQIKMKHIRNYHITDF